MIIIHTGSFDILRRKTGSEILKKDFSLLLERLCHYGAHHVSISGPIPTVGKGIELFSRLLGLNTWLSNACIAHMGLSSKQIKFFYVFLLLLPLPAAMLLFYVKHFVLFCTWNVLQWIQFNSNSIRIQFKWMAPYQATAEVDDELIISIRCGGGGKHRKHAWQWVQRTGVEKHCPKVCCWRPLEILRNTP